MDFQATLKEWAGLIAIALMLMSPRPLLAQQGTDVDVDVEVQVDRENEQATERNSVCDESLIEVSSRGQFLWIDFRATAESLLGFAHLPKTRAELLQANEVIALFHGGDTVFRLSPFAKCEMSQVSLGGQLIVQAPIEGEMMDLEPEDPDFVAHYRFVCSSMDLLENIYAEYFRYLPHLSCTQVELEGVEREISPLTRDNQVIELK